LEIEVIRKKSRTLEIEGIGLVLFERSKRARHLNITIRPFEGIRVAVPVGFSYKEAERVLRANINWVKKRQEHIRQAHQKNDLLLKGSSEIDRASARKILIKRLDELSTINGFSYNKVFIRNQKTRWGSCSAKNNISLNVKLLLLPEDLQDYVILHELVHTQVKNHSSKFWAELDKYVGDAKGCQSKLNEYGLLLI
jgi:predicted metal-dependent hydrolase